MSGYLTDQRDRPVSASAAVVVALLTGGYMLPRAVAALRGTSNHWTTFWITCAAAGQSCCGWSPSSWRSARSAPLVGRAQS